MLTFVFKSQILILSKKNKTLTILTDLLLETKNSEVIEEYLQDIKLEVLTSLSTVSKKGPPPQSCLKSLL